MCHPGWSVTHNVYQVVLELTEIYLSTGAKGVSYCPMLSFLEKVFD